MPIETELASECHPREEPVPSGGGEPSMSPLQSEFKHSPTPALDTNWETLVKNLKLSGMALIAVEQAALESRTEQTITLKITAAHQSLFTPNVIKQLEAALRTYYQQPMKIKLAITQEVTASPAKIKQQQQTKAHAAAEQALQTDPVFQTLQNEFDAEVVTDSVYQTIAE